MARVPYTGVPDVAPASAPPGDYQNIHSSPEDFGGIAAGAQQRFGAQVQQGAGDLVQAAVIKQDRFNQIATDDAFNQFQQGADNITYGNPSDPTAPKGLYTLKGADALSAGPQTVQQLTAMRDSIKSGLQNDAQRLQFDQASRRLLEYKSAEISRHLDSQADVYGLAVNEATIKNSVRTAGLAYNSDEALMHAVQDGRSGAVKAAQIRSGASADQTVLQNATSESDTNVIRGAVEGALAQNDGNRAAQIMNKFGNMLDPQMREVLNRTTQAHADAGAVAAASQGIILGTGPAVDINAQTNAAWQRLKATEHGVDSAGAALTSPKGALGLTQLEPATAQAVAAQHGVPYNPAGIVKDNSYNEMLGRLHFGDLMQKYDGNFTLAAAAYNAGAGRVDGWLSSIGDPRKGVMSDADFASKIPFAETKNYVMKVAQPGNTPGVATQHNPQAFATEQQMIQSAWTDAHAKFPDRPDLQQRMVEQVYQHIAQTNVLQSKYEAEQAKAQRDMQEQAGSAIVNQLIKDPTSFDPKSIADAPGLTWEQKQHLFDVARSDMAKSSTGGKELAEYGSGFWQAYQQVHAPTNVPGSITDASQLWSRGGPNGDLTLAGIDRLTKEVASSRKIDGDGPLQQQMFKTVHGQLTGANDALGLKDPKGEQLFLKFMTQAFKTIDEGKASGMTMQQLYNPDSPGYVGKIAAGMKRSLSQITADLAAANGSEAPTGEGQAAVPGHYSLQDLHAEMLRRELLGGNKPPLLPQEQRDEGPHAPY